MSNGVNRTSGKIAMSPIVVSVLASLVFSLLFTGIGLYGFSKYTQVSMKSDSLPGSGLIENTQTTSGLPAGTKVSGDGKSVPMRSPTKATGPGNYACDPYGICNYYDNPIGEGKCPMTFADSACEDKCGSTANRCEK